MVRLNESIECLITFCSTILFIVSFALSLYFSLHGGKGCRFSLANPLLITSFFLIVVAFLGFCSPFSTINSIVYLILLFFSIVSFAIFLVYLIPITHAPATKASPELGSKEQHLGDYSNFLKNLFVNDESDWHDILTSCVIRTQVCTNLAGHSKLQTGAAFYTKNLSPIESGCCRPPIECRFEYVNATFWTAPASGAAVYDSDCFNWRNEQKTLCYNCDSCKAGVLEYARKDLRIWAIVNLVLVLFLFSAWLALLFSLEEEEETLELH